MENEMNPIMVVRDDRMSSGFSFGGSYQNIIITLTYRDPDTGKLRSYSDHGERAGWADLAITSQNDERHAAEGSGLYAWGIEYRQVHSIGQFRAELMAKTLKGIRTRLDRVEDRYGPPESFGAYFQRIASLLGVEEVLCVKQGQTWADGDVVSIPAARYWIDARERDYIEQYQKEEAPA